MRYLIVLLLIASGDVLGKGLSNEMPVYTVDAMEINFVYNIEYTTDGMNKKTGIVSKLRFAQLIYWIWDPDADMNREGWVSFGFHMYEDEITGEGADIARKKVTVPRKNYKTGYWYVLAGEHGDLIKIRSKMLIGGIRGTHLFHDPEPDHKVDAENPNPYSLYLDSK